MKKTAVSFLLAAMAALLVAGVALAAGATNGDDTLYGTSGNDVIGGAGGNDRILGYAGDDKLYGATGNDVVYAGEGADIVYGGADDDRIFGDAGADKMYGNAGIDRIYGGGGNDVIKSGGDGKRDLVYCGYGPNDTVDLRDGSGVVDRYAVDCEKVIGDPKNGDNPTLRSIN